MSSSPPATQDALVPPTAPRADLEPRVREFGRRIWSSAQGNRGFWRRLKEANFLLEPMMRNEKLRVANLHFVDVLPVLRDSRDLAIHLEEYFGGVKLPFVPNGLKQLGLRAAKWGPIAPPTAWAVRLMAGIMAKRFIAGDSIPHVKGALQSLHARGMGFTIDLLGEAVVSDTESSHYQSQYMELLAGLDGVVKSWPESPRIDHIGPRRAPRLNLSLKVSAMDSQMTAVDPAACAERISARIRPILREAMRRGAFITIDMEHYDTKDLTLRVFRQILMEDEFRRWPDAGIAMQAYLRDTPGDLEGLRDWAIRRGTPVMVRLVRGAYWDYEVIKAQQHDWAIPVWTRKPETDICYEKCLAMLMDAHPHIELAVATHNVRSMALASVLAEQRGLKPGDYEFQMLYGMADEVKESLVREGKRVRVYVPFGELIPGMAYLVRRLLENTGSQSFLTLGMQDGAEIDSLLIPPTRPAADPPPQVSTLTQPEGPIEMKLSNFSNEPERRFTSESERNVFASEIEKVKTRLGARYPLVIGGAERNTAQQLESLDPSEPTRIVGVSASASREDAQAAITAAHTAFPAWRDTPVEKRAEILIRAAAIMRQRRDELSAWEVFEAGKPWREADGDICEAIDFLEYYARQAVRLWREQSLDVPGETNRTIYEPRGVVVVIAPWNFPLAILCGMTCAAIVAGNTVVMKPAPQTPVIAAHFARIFREAGLPPGVLNHLPGGDEAGDALVRDPRTAMIAFTGSVPVGTHIQKTAAELLDGQHHLKYVIAELGGKNAIIVDSDADLDDAVLGTVASAFGFAGQKCSACSRVIIVQSQYESFVKRLAECAASVRIGPSTEPGVLLGPVIDKESYTRIQKIIADVKPPARLVHRTDVSKLGSGYFIGPTIFAEVPHDSPLAQNEVFGPVLAAMPARDFDHALELANGTRYALTGGVYSRSPAHLEAAKQRFRVGNLYLNRKITGAMVGRHPFGGFKLSGTDAKAGGPDYLRHFTHARHITENTLRRGFAPDMPQEASMGS